MSRHYSARAQWNTAIARAANEPFDYLFGECECAEPQLDKRGWCNVCNLKRRPVSTSKPPAPAVEIHVTEQIPSNAALILTGEPGGQLILISNYYGPDDPRPMVCNKHGLQRHDKRGERWVCVLCRENSRAEGQKG